jgi:ribosomal protein S26
MNHTIKHPSLPHTLIKCFFCINDLILTSIVIKLERYDRKKRVSYL